MASTSFSIDWDQSKDEDTVAQEAEYRAPHDKMSWDVEFSPFGASRSKPKLPKFLQEREKQRAAEKTKKELSSPSRSTSDSNGRKSSSKSRSPLKSKSVPLASNKTSPRPSLSSSRPNSSSPRSSKHSPTIKQPLFSVSSPRRVQSSPQALDSLPGAPRSPRRIKSTVGPSTSGKTRESSPQTSQHPTPGHDTETKKLNDSLDNKYVSIPSVLISNVHTTVMFSQLPLKERINKVSVPNVFTIINSLNRVHSLSVQSTDCIT